MIEHQESSTGTHPRLVKPQPLSSMLADPSRDYKRSLRHRQIEPPLLPAFVLFFGFGLEPDKADLEEGAPAIAKLDPYMDARSCVEQ